MTVYLGLGPLGSVVTGFVVDVAGWIEAFGVLAALMAASALLLAASMFAQYLPASVVTSAH